MTTVTLTLSHQYSRTVVLTAPGLTTTVDAGEEEPVIPLPDASVNRIEAIDVLEHVIDEEAWLLECARVLAPGGRIRVQVPREGVTSWFESLNIYRYLVDTLGRGHDPRETKLNGWHRQYKERELRRLFAKAGLTVAQIDHHSIGLAEIPTLVRMFIGDFIRQDRSTGKRAKDARQRLDRLDAHIPFGPLSRRLRITGTKPA